MEANRPGVMSTQRKCMRRSQGCMAAQVIFHQRCEPTQVKIAISTGDHKSCFAVTVLRCDFLHDIIGRKCGNETYTRRIAREQFVREGIDLVIRNWHAHQSITMQEPLTGRLVGKQETMRLLSQNHLHATPPSLGSMNAGRKSGCTSIRRPPGSTTASPQLGSCCVGDFLAANSTGTNRPAAEDALLFLFQRCFFRCLFSVPKLKPRLRQNSLRRRPLLTNSATNC